MIECIRNYRKYILTSDLAPSTKKEYEGLCFHILLRAGRSDTASEITRKSIKGCSPSKARKICIVLRNSYILRYGSCDHIIIPTIHNAKKRPILTWTMNEYNYFTTHATPTASRIARFAFMTGQRVSDLVDFKSLEMGIGKVNIIQITQHKTGTKCYIPVTRELRKLINSSKYEYVIHTIMGTKLTASAAAYQIKSDIKNLNMRKRLSIHGLRKLFAATMASHGCTVYEIAAVTGHLNVNNLSLYTHSYDRLMAARNLLKKIVVDVPT